MAAYAICWWQKKNFQNFTVICRKPHVASSICLRATIFQNPEGTLWTHCICFGIDGGVHIGTTDDWSFKFSHFTECAFIFILFFHELF
jgi:hypothetical protein